MTWEVAGDVAFYALAFMAGLFVALYAVLSPWWRTEAGRNIMAVMGSLAVIGLWGSYLLAAGGRGVWFYPVRFFMFTGLALALAWRVVMFVRVQVIRRRKEDNREVR